MNTSAGLLNAVVICLMRVVRGEQLINTRHTHKRDGRGRGLAHPATGALDRKVASTSASQGLRRRKLNGRATREFGEVALEPVGILAKFGVIEASNKRLKCQSVRKSGHAFS
jgi:hypothetical protein